MTEEGYSEKQPARVSQNLNTLEKQIQMMTATLKKKEKN